MQHFENKKRIERLLKAALECSIYISPTNPGLTYDELLECGRMVDLQPGEIGDTLREVTTIYIGARYILPDPTKIIGWVAPNILEEPEYRNIAAFDFWSTSMAESARVNGAARARLDRDVIIARAEAQHISKHDMEVALAVELLCGHLIVKNDTIVPAPGRLAWPLLSQQMDGGIGARRYNESRAKVYPIVKDIIGRRTDGRPRYVEAMDAFTERLDTLGYGHFKLWWTQLVSQLRQSDPETTPVSVLILAAALVEGALTFVVKHGRSLGVGVFGSKTFDENPQRWKLDDLVNGAGAGQTAAILDNRDRTRAEMLIRSRQRIHAGRMLSDFPGGAPDLRPEEAREAKAVADLVVRRVLDWLEKHPHAA